MAVGAAAKLFVTLKARYPNATSQQVLDAVVAADRGARILGLKRDDPVILLAAESNLRVTLGVDPDVARLDPERHAGKKSRP